MRQLTTLEGHLARGEWLQAKREAARLMVFQESLSPRELGRLHRGAARAAVGLGEDAYGIVKLLEIALPQALQGRDWDMLGTIRAELGTAYSMVGDWAEALETFLAYHLDFHRYSEAKRWLGRVEYNTGVVCVRRRDYEQAVTHYEAALTWFVEKGLTREAGEVHQNLAWVYCLTKRPEAGELHLECADTFRDRMSPEYSSMQLICRSLCDYLRGNIRAAILGVEEVLQPGRPGMTPEHRGDAAWIGGQIALDIGHLDGARYFIELATQAALDGKDWGLASQISVLKQRLSELERGDGGERAAR